jgi:hypothetical protein
MSQAKHTIREREKEEANAVDEQPLEVYLCGEQLM